MSIEFGIPVRGSTITLDGVFRVDIDESVFHELQATLTQAARAAGHELDLNRGTVTSLEAQAFMDGLLRVARHAQASSQPLVYLGL